MRDGKVHEPRGNAAVKCVPERLPLGREVSERVIHRISRLFGPIDQQRDRRDHFGVIQERNQRIGVGRSLDKDDVRRDRLQGPPHAPRRAGAVVAYAQNMNGIISRDRRAFLPIPKG